MTHICVGKLTIIASNNGLSAGRRQAIIWTNATILLIGPLRTNFNEIFIEIQIFSFKKMHLKMAAAKWRPFCLGLHVLTWYIDGILPKGPYPPCLRSTTTFYSIDDFMSIGSQGTNISDNSNAFKILACKMHLGISSAQYRSCPIYQWADSQHLHLKFWIQCGPSTNTWRIHTKHPTVCINENA